MITIRNLDMMTTFENAKEGDMVYSPTFGWGEIECIDLFSRRPIHVRFFHDNNSSLYTLNGYYSDLPIQSLFWDEVSIEAPKKPVGVKVVNGVEIPDISYIPDPHHHCNIPAPTRSALYERLRCYSNTHVAHISAHGLCYPDTEKGKAAAILHAKAMLGIRL
jgi:hypothetical protein